MKLTLIGYRGTGKTTLGQKVAERLGWRFIDTDDLIEERDGRMISEIFEQDGEPYFREIERSVIKDLRDEENVVIGAGGGAVMDDANVRNLKHKGRVVLLTAKPETIHHRIHGTARSRQQRPSLTKLDPFKEIKHMLSKRKMHYESAADLIVDTDQNSVEGAVEKIADYINTQAKGES